MIRLAALLCCIPSLALAETRLPSDEHFRVDTIATGFVDAMEMAVTPTGEIFVVERTGALKVVAPKTGTVSTLNTLPVDNKPYADYDFASKKIGARFDPANPINNSPNNTGLNELPPAHPGSKLIASTTCLACHTTTQKSIGPTYKEVAKKYAKDPQAVPRLAEKILKGGTGVWGQQPMPPRPQHNIEETQQMVEAILKVDAP